LEYTAHYEGISRPFDISVRNAPDRIPNGTSIDRPWYNEPDRDGGPQALIPDTETSGPTINDSPSIRLRTLGHLLHPQNRLASVRAQGNFVTWLVVHHRDDPVDDLSTYQFLYHIEIEFDRRWNNNYLGTSNVPDASSFTPTGSQRVTHEGDGKGNEDPVINGRFAYERLRQQIADLHYPGEAEQDSAGSQPHTRRSQDSMTPPDRLANYQFNQWQQHSPSRLDNTLRSIPPIGKG
jgi:hypothetical protein